MNTKKAHTSTIKTTKQTQKTAVSAIAPEYVVHQLNEDVRNSILVVSVLINAFVFIAWLVVQVTTRYDAALIGYLQNR